jgi:hypothetical protein
MIIDSSNRLILCCNGPISSYSEGPRARVDHARLLRLISYLKEAWQACQTYPQSPRKDAIVETFAHKPGQFLLDVKDSENEYFATALRRTHTYRDEPGELLGFIRYSKAKGTLELTNFKAQLERKALDLGFTTKREKKQLAGTHGEGFKVASLVMLRGGHQVRYEASKYRWTFRFDGSKSDQLYCEFRPIAC